MGIKRKAYKTAMRQETTGRRLSHETLNPARAAMLPAFCRQTCWAVY